ncbi:hypothetical protein NQ315_000638 [Exocentrus adspersus]|uniref:Nuclease HARBI1 n=1 Tax=Exocentrus adspersus TaxID=1586481 RepID=A0AAV8VNU5_9CUCU|nr:hypothetical protein NQ315_000638 [Exocentrus adspersus]
MEIEDEIYLNVDGDLLDILDFGFPRRIYDRSNPFDTMDELSFFMRFRLQEDTVVHVLEHIEENLEFNNDFCLFMCWCVYLININTTFCTFILAITVSPINQLLTALRFYATCSHQNTVGDMGMHQSTASRVILKVSRQIAMLAPQYIKMPS